MNYKPIEINFGDEEEIRKRLQDDSSLRRVQQALPLLVPKGTFLNRLYLTIINHDDSDEFVVHLEYMGPNSWDLTKHQSEEKAS